MTDQQMQPAPRPKGGFSALWRFLPMLWPKDDTELRARVVIAVVLVLAGKAVGFVGPYALKVAVDRMTGHAAFAVVAGLVLAYAAARFAGVLSDNIRNATFEKVGQDAARRLAGKVFRHVHDLSLRFHLERRTGSLTKIVERGTKSIDMMLYFILFNIAPTVIELAGICVIFYVKFGAGLVAATLAIVAIYIAFTRWVTDWRSRHSAADERGRQSRDRPRRRFASQLRDGEIFRRRGPRGEALRGGGRRFCSSIGPQRGVARLAEHRPVADHQPDDGRGDGVHGVGLEPRPIQRRRRGVDQRLADATLPPARHARLGVPVDPPGPDRHGGDVGASRHAGGGR